MRRDWTLVLRPTSRRILDQLVGGPKTLTQLAERLHVAKPSLVPQLQDLQALGVIKRYESVTGRGREVGYEIGFTSVHFEIDGVNGTVLSWATSEYVDLDLPLTAQIEQAEARDEIALFLRHLRGGLGEEAWSASFVLVFGSAARGEMTWKSDIDLLILTGESQVASVEGRLDDIVDWVQQSKPYPLRVTVATTASFLAMDRKIFAEAAREGLIVSGRRRGALGEGVEVWSRMARYKAISI